MSVGESTCMQYHTLGLLSCRADVQAAGVATAGGGCSGQGGMGCAACRGVKGLQVIRRPYLPAPVSSRYKALSVLYREFCWGACDVEVILRDVLLGLKCKVLLCWPKAAHCIMHLVVDTGPTPAGGCPCWCIRTRTQAMRHVRPLRL